MQDLPKFCADSLRTTFLDQYNFKLKATHAHELVAAFFGYKTKNSLLADSQYPISKLDQAEFVVMIPDEEIDYRRKSLNDLPAELPDNHTLGGVIFDSLSSGGFYSSSYPPFKSFKEFGEFLARNNDFLMKPNRLFGDIPVHFEVVSEITDSFVLLTIYRTNPNPTKDSLVHSE